MNKMHLVVTDITRLRENRICVAGMLMEPFEGRATLSAIRPTTGTLNHTHLLEYGGLFALGHTLELTGALYRGSKPEVEDYSFYHNRVQRRDILTAESFWQLLKRASYPNLNDLFGPELSVKGTSMVVPVGQGKASLGKLNCTLGLDSIYLRSIDNQSLRIRIKQEDHRLDLSVTDLRFYRLQDQVWQLDHERISALQRQLERPRAVVLNLGLGRAWKEGQPPNHHWLQVNAIHLEGCPVW